MEDLYTRISIIVEGDSVFDAASSVYKIYNNVSYLNINKISDNKYRAYITLIDIEKEKENFKNCKGLCRWPGGRGPYTR